MNIGTALNDREMVDLSLALCKHCSEVYGVGALEAEHPQIRQAFSQFQQQSAQNAEQAWRWLYNRGLYETRGATPQQIQEVAKQGQQLLQEATGNGAYQQTAGQGASYVPQYAGAQYPAGSYPQPGNYPQAGGYQGGSAYSQQR